MKLNRIRTLFSSSLAIVCLLFSQNVLAADYKNRLSISPFENPTGWAAPYQPGDLVTQLLLRSISDDKTFHISDAPSKSKMRKNSAAMKARKTRLNHPIQFVLEGKVLNFTAGKPPSRAQIILNIGDGMKQKAEVEVELKLINHHIGRTVETKKLKIVTSAGTVPFDVDTTAIDFDSNKFQKSSIGMAMYNLNEQINAFLMTALHPLPLDGEVISVNPEEKEVVINVGQIHGIDFGDLFNVYAVALQYKDPFTQWDLGNKFTRRGVIRVKDVQEGFSIAAIEAGEGFEMGELVRSRKTNRIQLDLRAPEPKTQFP